MRGYFSTTALAISLLGSVLVPWLKADDLTDFISILGPEQWDRNTKITIDHPIEIQDTPLSAGSYVLKLTDTFGVPIVQIFNADENHLIATMFAVQALQLKPRGERPFQFYEEA